MWSTRPVYIYHHPGAALHENFPVDFPLPTLYNIHKMYSRVNTEGTCWQRAATERGHTIRLDTYLPQWLLSILPENDHYHTRNLILKAAAIRGSQLAHRVHTPQVEVYHPHTVKAVMLLFPVGQAEMLYRFGMTVGTTSKSGALRTAIMTGLQLTATHMGVMSPVRTLPFTPTEWMALLRSVGMYHPLTTPNSHYELLNEAAPFRSEFARASKDQSRYRRHALVMRFGIPTHADYQPPTDREA